MSSDYAGRVLLPVTLASYALRVNYDGGGATTVSLTDGTYWHSCDDSGTDLLAHIEARLAAVVGGTWGLEVNGVDFANSAHPYGAIRVTSDADFILVASSGSWTLPDRVLGMPSGTGDLSSSSSVLWLSHVHRYGYYPQPTPMTDRLAPQKRRVVLRQTRLSGVPDSEVVGTMDAIECEWQQVHSARVRLRYAADSDWATAAGLAAGDENAPFESFALDIVTAGGGPWRVYPQLSDPDTYYGPFYLPENSPLWEDPLGLSSEVRSQSLYTQRLAGQGALS